MYVSNALEECYRLSSSIYESQYETLLKGQLKIEYLRNYSAQATYVLGKAQNRIELSKHYYHLVNNFLKILKFYLAIFKVRFDVDLGSVDVSSRQNQQVIVIRQGMAASRRQGCHPWPLDSGNPCRNDVVKIGIKINRLKNNTLILYEMSTEPSNGSNVWLTLL
jgi:hypothetical protein